MRVRCTKANHVIDVPDDLVGARLRCPQCGCLFFAEPIADQIQAAPPAPTGPVADDAEQKIYDGLPPLSLMMALRRQKGGNYDAEDFDARFEMTADDWRALDAYESVLLAAYGMRTSVFVAVAALLANLPVLFLFFNHQGADAPLGGLGDMAVLASLLFLGLCLAVLFLGSFALQRVRLSTLVDLALAATWGAMLIFAIATLFGGLCLATPSYDGAGAILGIPFNLIAIFDLGRSALKISRALKQVEPPEITNRVVEALKYLE